MVASSLPKLPTCTVTLDLFRYCTWWGSYTVTPWQGSCSTAGFSRTKPHHFFKHIAMLCDAGIQDFTCQLVSHLFISQNIVALVICCSSCSLLSAFLLWCQPLTIFLSLFEDASWTFWFHEQKRKFHGIGNSHAHCTSRQWELGSDIGDKWGKMQDVGHTLKYSGGQVAGANGQSWESGRQIHLRTRKCGRQLQNKCQTGQKIWKANEKTTGHNWETRGKQVEENNWKTWGRQVRDK